MARSVKIYKNTIFCILLCACLRDEQRYDKTPELDENGANYLKTDPLFSLAAFPPSQLSISSKRYQN
jgi:hypothetical protein